MLRHFTDLDAELAVGSAVTGPEDIAQLTQHGVQAVVNLQSDEDLKSRGLDWAVLWQIYLRAGLKVTRVPIIDFDPGDLGRHLSAAVLAVDKHRAKGRKVYVHCNAGMNRSPSVVIAWIAKHRGASLEEAVRWVSDRHACVPYPDILRVWAQSQGVPLSAR